MASATENTTHHPCPVMLVAGGGGTGIEERAEKVNRLTCSVAGGPMEGELVEAVRGAGVGDGQVDDVCAAVRGVFEIAKELDARSVEINPLVVTGDGRVMAADCRMTIDDY